MNFDLQKTVHEPQQSGERADWQKGFWKSKTSCFTLKRYIKNLMKNGASDSKTTCFTEVTEGDTFFKSITYVNLHYYRLL